MNITRIILSRVSLICLIGIGTIGSGLLVDVAQTQPADPLGIVATDPPGGTSVFFGSPLIEPIPADFFGPGSDPFTGQVVLKGSATGGDIFANPPILVQRYGDPIIPTAAPGTVGSVDIEIVQLDLVGVAPITVSYSGGAYTEQWEVHVGPSLVPAPTGILNATKTHDNGGYFDSTLFVQLRFTFTHISSGMIMALDTGLEGTPPFPIDTIGGDWVHNMDPALELVAPSDGAFVFGVAEILPGDPNSQCPAPFLASEANGSLDLMLKALELLPLPDPLVSIPGDGLDGSMITFGPTSNPPIPADFFEPGSEPFTGVVNLIGEPLGMTPFGDYYVADTLVQRSANPFDRCALPGPDVHIIDIEIVALNLHSIQSIEVIVSGGVELWELHMGLSWIQNEKGTARGVKTHANGGYFDMVIPVQPLFTFTRISDGAVRVFDTGLEGRPPLQFDYTGCNWVQNTDPSLNITAPSNGSFVPGVVESIPGNPATQALAPMTGIEMGTAGQHVLVPAIDPFSRVDIPARQENMRVFPNPFNPLTKIRFALRYSGPVVLRIYDLQGSLVRTLIDSDLPEGPHEIRWQAIDDQGQRVGSGVYLGILEANGKVQSTKMAVIK